ncbi:unnamed protein product [Calypogeia fissa]
MVHGEGLEVAVAVVEVADVAWEALERRHAHSAAVIEHEQKFWEEKDELARQHEENRRLRELLQEYQRALEHMQMKGGGGGEVEIEKTGGSGESLNSDTELYVRLKEKVDSPEFLAKLAGGNEAPKSPDRMEINVADDPSSWLWVTDHDLIERDTKFEQDGLGSDGYLIITHDDIVDGIASFMARYISSMPQTKGMTPQELQKAISQAFTDLEKKGRLRVLWNCGKFMYTATSWGATAVGLYRNPVIVRAAMMAVWTSCCVVVRLLT